MGKDLFRFYLFRLLTNVIGFLLILLTLIYKAGILIFGYENGKPVSNKRNRKILFFHSKNFVSNGKT